MPEFSFDSRGQEPSTTEFSPIPAGPYLVAVTGSELKGTRSGGQQLVIEFTVIHGDYTNRKLWFRVNTKNANPEAVRVGMDQLLRMTSAMGVASFNTTEELHGRECVANVVIRRSDEYGDSNEIRSFRAKKQQQVEKAVEAPQVQQAVPDDDIPF